MQQWESEWKAAKEEMQKQFELKEAQLKDLKITLDKNEKEHALEMESMKKEHKSIVKKLRNEVENMTTELES